MYCVRLWNLFNTKGQLLTSNLCFKSFSMSIWLYTISLQDWFRISCSLLTFLISTAAPGQGNTSAPRIDCFFPWSAICLGLKAHFISSIWTLCEPSGHKVLASRGFRFSHWHSCLSRNTPSLSFVWIGYSVSCLRDLPEFGHTWDWVKIRVELGTGRL